jgi:N-acetyl-anhydromuramyl-L-alanine amidase AmpD
MGKKVFYLKSTKAKDLRFKVVHLDKATMRATLQGDTGAPFETSVTEENLKKYGYEIEVVMEPDHAALSA